jgi:mRNA interferase YafQ
MMRRIQVSSSFKKDMKRMKKQGKDPEEIKEVLKKLASGSPLQHKHRDHPLQGDLKGARECHIKDDWIMIYEIRGNILSLVRTGSHVELYKR